MFEDRQLQKTYILLEQKRFGEAEKLLNLLLANDPNNIEYLTMLSEVKLQQDQYDAAEQIINQAISLNPDESVLYYNKSRIATQQEEFVKAEVYINQAISMYPYDAEYFAFAANIKLARKKYQEALEQADKALEIDAENILALNMRSTALLKLDDKEASFKTIEGALREDPNNAYTHTNYGWGLLEKGDHQQALVHFKEALQQNPNYTYAQQGMLEAIKASNPVYRLFLKYAFFMGNLTSKYQWGVIIGIYIGFRLLRSIARNNEALAPYLTPLIIALALMAFSTWVIGPISNLFLRFNKYGQLLLSDEEKMSSNLVAGSFSLFVLGLLLYFLLADEKMLSIAVYGFAMMLPLGVVFSPAKNKNTMRGLVIGLAIVGFLSIILTFSSGALFNGFSILFILGFIAFQWITNYLLIRESNY